MCTQPKMKIRKGDEVVVTSGRDAGKRGEVVRVLRAEQRVIVRDVNVVKRHMRPSQTQAGGIVDKEMPIHVSNVALIDPKANLATKVGYKFLEDGRKVRFARRSGEIIDQ